MNFSFDVCIPTYNRFKFVKQLAESIPSNITVHVSDNGEYLSRNLFGENIDIRCPEGVLDIFDNWTFAANLSESDFFFLPSDDDLYKPNMFGVVSHVLNKDIEQCGMIIFGHDLINEHGNIVGSWLPNRSGIVPAVESFDMFKYGVDARMPSVLFNKSKFIEVGGIDTDFKLTASDSFLIQKMALKYPVCFVREIISGYRVWPGSLTGKRITTDLWHDEIEMWMNKLVFFIKENKIGEVKKISNITDEIKAANFLSALRALVTPRDKRRFIFNHRFPVYANRMTQLRIIKNLFL